MGVRGLQLSDFTTFSMVASWDRLGSNVRQYRVSYISARGDRAEQVVSADFIHSNTVLIHYSFHTHEHTGAVTHTDTLQPSLTLSM